MRCCACETDLGTMPFVGRRDECPQCHADLHVCRQCRFFDPAANNQCREPLAELVVDKEKANFCDYFEFAGGKPAAAASSEAKKKLEGLFRK
ncbi:MAG: hypothetical protein HY465_01815 [Deltaproteobacteria bacterium]|nr:hypothetical protein [Deltaproteobacteria bacterium]